jgi:hypothetical protein
VSREELERLLGARFTLLSVERPPDSVAQRAGQEWLVEARVTAAG